MNKTNQESSVVQRQGSRVKQPSIVSIAHLIVVLLITLFAISMIVLLLWSKYNEQTQRTINMRGRHEQIQKDITRREVERIIHSIRERQDANHKQAIEMAKQRVYQAHNIAMGIYTNFQKRAEENDIKDMILSALRSVRFDNGNGYYFVTSIDGTVLVAVHAERENQHYSDLASKREQEVTGKIINIAREQKEGVYEYQWSMPGKEGANHQKVSYVKLFEPYNFVIGTGLYIDDIDAITKQELLEEITKIAYGKNGYFFVNNLQGTILAHGDQTELVGTSIWDYEDSYGTKVFQELLKATEKPNGAFCRYWWRMPETGNERPKIAFAMAIPEWNWLIGTGLYIDDVDAEVISMQNHIRKQSMQEIIFVILIASAIIILVYLLLGILFRALRRDLELFNHNFTLAAQQNVQIDENKIKFVELLRIAKNANRMLREKEQSEEERLRLKKLESVGVLAGGIAHDFNNLLTSIVGNIDLVKKSLSPDDSIAKEYINQAESAMESARKLAMQLLTFSKGGAPIKKVISLHKELITCAEFSLRGANIKLETNVPSDLLPVEADLAQIHQVISNLVINAQQAMPDGGTIFLAAENKGKDCISITVRDQGCGIPADILDNIFDPYFTTKDQGSGLGLASCHAIIQKHGGTIDVKSTPDKGTVFTIILPASQKPLESETVEQHMPSASQGVCQPAKILVIDDLESIRKLLKNILALSGHNVQEASNDVEAKELFTRAMQENKPFDLVITDLTIPGSLSGKEIADALKAIDPNINIIVSSGYSGSQIIAQYQRYGFAACIPKPYRIQTVNEIVTKVLNAQT